MGALVELVGFRLRVAWVADCFGLLEVAIFTKASAEVFG
jgi:hypothetical protein